MSVMRIVSGDFIGTVNEMVEKVNLKLFASHDFYKFGTTEDHTNCAKAVH